jgi:hypothetical protein
MMMMMIIIIIHFREPNKICALSKAHHPSFRERTNPARNFHMIKHTYSPPQSRARTHCHAKVAWLTFFFYFNFFWESIVKFIDIYQNMATSPIIQKHDPAQSNSKGWTFWLCSQTSNSKGWTLCRDNRCAPSVGSVSSSLYSGSDNLPWNTPVTI